MQMQREIHAVIGVRRAGASTFYVKRSNDMANYPSVWSLLSIQYNPIDVPDERDLTAVAPHFKRMSEQRLGGVFVNVKAYLTSGSSDRNPMGVNVTLHLYEIEFDEEPSLNGRYYTDSAWMTAVEYEECCAGQVCGLCLRLWSDYAWLKGYTDRPFIPSVSHELVAA